MCYVQITMAHIVLLQLRLFLVFGTAGGNQYRAARSPHAVEFRDPLLLLRLCIQKVIYHRHNDRHALHQRHVCCIGQNGQSRR